jgi:hypothetical protein
MALSRCCPSHKLPAVSNATPWCEGKNAPLRMSSAIVDTRPSESPRFGPFFSSHELASSGVTNMSSMVIVGLLGRLVAVIGDLLLMQPPKHCFI